MCLLLDTCTFLDPHFKDKLSTEDKPEVRLIDEIKPYDEYGILPAGGRPSHNVPQKKKGKFSSIFGWIYLV